MKEHKTQGESLLLFILLALVFGTPCLVAFLSL